MSGHDLRTSKHGERTTDVWHLVLQVREIRRQIQPTMTLSLPEDAETFLTDGYEQLHSPCVYALILARPDDVGQAWDREFETRPPWFDQFRDARQVVYVGATNDCLSRLEDHRDGEVRVGVLQRICEVESLRNVWLFEETDRAFERESGIAVAMQNEYPDVYVHSR